MDIAKIEEIIKILESSQCEELTVRMGNTSVSIKKKPRALAGTAKKKAEASSLPKQEEKTTKEKEERLTITSPMVGLFHYNEKPVKKGDVVEVGQVVGTIESMKLINDVVAKVGGVVCEVLIEDGAPVEYGQHLFYLDNAEED